ncbi:hypothetical protein [Nonomuraea sp. NPDC050310]|uniref:hypothetical protein n=1 Tax=Nonomuraea sp. NPDC050310 TaxID=3154935 RepID=UPI0033DF46E1
MTQPDPRPILDLRGVTSRHDNAIRLLAVFAKSAPALDGIWRHIFAALADTPYLCTDLADLRLQRANLIAAMRATLAAHQDGEPEPHYYLRDELESLAGDALE